MAFLFSSDSSSDLRSPLLIGEKTAFGRFSSDSSAALAALLLEDGRRATTLLIAQSVERGIVATLLFNNSPQVTGSIPVQKTPFVCFLWSFLALVVTKRSSSSASLEAVGRDH